MSACLASPKNYWHLWVPYRVKATGKSGECCYFCGVEREEQEQ